MEKTLEPKKDVDLGPGFWRRLDMPWEVNASIDAQRSRMRPIREEIPWKAEVGSGEKHLCTQRVDVSMMDLRQGRHPLGLNGTHS